MVFFLKQRRQGRRRRPRAAKASSVQINAHAQRVNQSQDLAPPQEGPAGLPVVWNNKRLAPAQLRQAALVLRDMGPAAKVLIYTLRYAHSAGPMGNLSAIQQKTDGPYA